jgi:hypothetical protein
MTALAAECRRRRVATAILATLRRYRRPMTGGELLFYGCPGVLAAERDAAISELLARGLVLAGDRPYVQRGATRIFRVYSLARPAGGGP